MSERSLSSMEWRLESFESRASLWRLIEEFVPESERLEIKEALGEDLVDETLDLQNEVSKLNVFLFVKFVHMHYCSDTFCYLECFVMFFYDKCFTAVLRSPKF